MEVKDETCFECSKAICFDEYAVNWGSCNECFDRGFEEYMRTGGWQLEFPFHELPVPTD